MSRIIKLLIQNSLHQNKNREEVKNSEIGYLSDLSIFGARSFPRRFFPRGFFPAWSFTCRAFPR